MLKHVHSWKLDSFIQQSNLYPIYISMKKNSRLTLNDLLLAAWYRFSKHKCTIPAVVGAHFPKLPRKKSNCNWETPQVQCFAMSSWAETWQHWKLYTWKKKDVYCWLCWEGVHENCIKLWNCFDKESLQSKSTAGLDNQVSWGYGNTIPIAFLCVIYLRMLVITCHTTAQTGKHWKALLDMSHLPTLSTPAQNFWNHERWRYEHELPGVQRHGMLGASCASTSLVVIVWHNFNLVGINASKEQINTSAISWQGN